LLAVLKPAWISTPQYNARRENWKTEIFGILKRKELPFVKPAAIRGVHPQQAERRSAYRIAIESEVSRCTKLEDWRERCPLRESLLLVQFLIALKEEIIALY
jgi:hypothetical protein